MGLGLGRRARRDVRLAVLESEQRLLDAIAAKVAEIGDKLDEQARASRRRFLSSTALGTLGVIIGVIGIIKPRQQGRDARVVRLGGIVRARVRFSGNLTVTTAELPADGGQLSV